MLATIKDFEGHWGSGLALLTVETENGEIRTIPCDNAETCRQFNRAFGDAIVGGILFNVDAVKGKKIEYWTDDIGVLAGFNVPGEES
jgi:hypothetical protein